MPRVRIVRCPRCGSTDAASDESRSRADISCMVCGACGFTAMVDDHEVGFDWNTSIELAVGAPLPPFVAPLDDDDVDRPRDPPRAPPTREARGCSRCAGDNAEEAWLASGEVARAAFVEESHFSLRVVACGCGAPFAHVFAERVDWRGGDDDQTWLRVPLAEAGVQGLSATFRQAGEGAARALLGRLAAHERFLVRHAGAVWWRDGVFFAIPRHD